MYQHTHTPPLHPLTPLPHPLLPLLPPKIPEKTGGDSSDSDFDDLVKSTSASLSVTTSEDLFRQLSSDLDHEPEDSPPEPSALAPPKEGVSASPFLKSPQPITSTTSCISTGSAKDSSIDKPHAASNSVPELPECREQKGPFNLKSKRPPSERRAPPVRPARPPSYALSKSRPSNSPSTSLSLSSSSKDSEPCSLSLSGSIQESTSTNALSKPKPRPKHPSSLGKSSLEGEAPQQRPRPKVQPRTPSSSSGDGPMRPQSRNGVRPKVRPRPPSTCNRPQRNSSPTSDEEQTSIAQKSPSRRSFVAPSPSQSQTPVETKSFNRPPIQPRNATPNAARSTSPRPKVQPRHASPKPNMAGKPTPGKPLRPVRPHSSKPKPKVRPRKPPPHTPPDQKNPNFGPVGAPKSRPLRKPPISKSKPTPKPRFTPQSSKPSTLSTSSTLVPVSTPAVVSNQTAPAAVDTTSDSCSPDPVPSSNSETKSIPPSKAPPTSMTEDKSSDSTGNDLPGTLKSHLVYTIITNLLFSS